MLEKYSITIKELQKISKKEPAIQHLKGKIGDVIKVTRASATAGTTQFYRVIVCIVRKYLLASILKKIHLFNLILNLSTILLRMN